MSVSLRDRLVWLYKYADGGTAGSGRPKSVYTRYNSPQTHKAWWMTEVETGGREYTLGGSKHAVDAVFNCHSECPVAEKDVLKDEAGKLLRVLAVLKSDIGQDERRILCIRADGAVANNLIDTP